MTQSDMMEFLTARLDEDERTAEGLAGATRILGQGPDFYGAGGPAAGAFWERFNPARVLREVEAHRAILREHRVAPGRDYCLRCADDTGPGCGTTRSLVAIWSDHPDYRQEWTP